jgi:hypothetical protein
LSVSVTHEKQVVPVNLGGSILKNFPLKDLTEPTGVKNYPVEYALHFKGRFFNEANRPESALLNVIQTNPQKFFITQSDESGLFELNDLNFQDTAVFSIKASGSDKKLYGKVELISDDMPPIKINIPTSPLHYEVMETPQRHYTSYETPADARLLNEVTVRAERMDPDPPAFKPYGKGQYRLEKKDINTRYGNLLMAIQGRFPGLIVRQTNVENEELRWVVYSVRMQTSSILHVKEVSVLVNGMLYSGEPAKILLNLDPITIESIEYRDGINVRLGAEGGFGTLYITTRTGMSSEPGPPSEPIDVIKLVGFNKAHAFPAPDYSDSTIDSNEPDYRSLLYWNPMLIPEKETGNATFTFYSGDLGGRYRIDVQGLTSEGEPVRLIHYVFVREK